MSSKYPGGIISKTAPTPSGPYADSTAPGVWTLEQQAYWQKLGQWPTQGNANPSAFIENLFQTWLYTGTGAAQTITNGVDLSTNGGMVWFKDRTVANSNRLFDTVRGTSSVLTSNSTGAAFSSSNMLTAFNTTGFSVGTDTSGGVNDNGDSFASWTFRKQPKFFDVVTWTGNGTTQDIAHSLGSAPGCIIAKRTNNTGSWRVYHRSVSTQYGNLNSTIEFQTISAEYVWGNNTTTVAPTSTVFTVGNDAGLNASGDTYVAYLYAHNAGGFGLTGTDNVISCGQCTAGTFENLGYEPQWILLKNPNSSGSGWKIYDNMRGGGFANYVNQNALEPNTSSAESANGQFSVSATGFTFEANAIYIAIRRGPMKVPTSGTSVFNVQSATAGTSHLVGFPPDLVLNKDQTSGAYPFNWGTRLQGNDKRLQSATTNGELTGTGYWKFDDKTNYFTNTVTASGYDWSFQRAPSFFDEVCYTGTGSATTQTHNLGVAPELMIVKVRGSTGINWSCYHYALGNTQVISLNEDIQAYTSTQWNNTTPTASVFSVGTQDNVNGSAKTYVAYLFATCAGVSKVGSYTGTGTTQQVNCGFTGGARFVLIKRTDEVASGNPWYVWDSARGIVAGNDPYLLLNSTAAEVTSTDYVDTYSAGFEISSTAPSAINASGGTFIFLAIA